MSVRRSGWRAYSALRARRTSFLTSVGVWAAGSGEGDREGEAVVGRRCCRCCCVEWCCVGWGRVVGSASASASDEEDASAREMASARRLSVRGGMLVVAGEGQVGEWDGTGLDSGGEGL